MMDRKEGKNRRVQPRTIERTLARRQTPSQAQGGKERKLPAYVNLEFLAFRIPARSSPGPAIESYWLLAVACFSGRF